MLVLNVLGQECQNIIWYHQNHELHKLGQCMRWVEKHVKRLRHKHERIMEICSLHLKAWIKTLRIKIACCIETKSMYIYPLTDLPIHKMKTRKHTETQSESHLTPHPPPPPLPHPRLSPLPSSPSSQQRRSFVRTCIHIRTQTDTHTQALTHL